MKIEMYERLFEIGEEEDMSVGEIMDWILPDHLDLINREPGPGLREQLLGIIDEEIESLEEDIRFARDFEVKERP